MRECDAETRTDREGQRSIRADDQYRVCFVWTPNGHWRARSPKGFSLSRAEGVTPPAE